MNRTEQDAMNTERAKHPSAGSAVAEDAVTLPVEGMECAACAVRIERQLGKLAGVREASVNYATGGAVVRYAPGEADLPALVRTVEKTGYGVRTDALALPLRTGAAPPAPEALTNLFAHTPGVLSAAVEGETRVRVTFVPGVADPAALAGRLADAGLVD
ncbi:MAG: heavy metal-associated domain-containing protein, partial [Rhodothermales bacterium]|nr:heavy metal-associated domain-containing protein [Rhodothermales bacterium]